jgi:hypothetical protein
MSTALAPAQLNEIAAQWRVARQLYPVYAVVVRQHKLALEPSRDLEYPVDRSEPEALDRVRHWFAEADSKIEVWQLRQVLQTSELGSEPALRALVTRILEKEEHTESDRDKADFLLAQYFFHCAPEKLHSTEPTLDDVALVLEPVLGECVTEAPPWLTPLEEIVAELKQCQSLSDMLARGTLARARQLKIEAGDKFFGSSSLLVFTRFNFLVRGTFVRLIHNDLHAIRFALHGLEQRGQKSFDCTVAGLGAAETPDHLRQFCHEWKTLFRAAYSSGQSFQQLIKLRELLEAALAAPVPQVAPAPAPKPEPVAQVAPVAPPQREKKKEAPKTAPAAAVAQSKPVTPAPAAKPAPVAKPAAESVRREIAAAYQAAPKAEKPAAKAPIAIGGKPAPAAAAQAADIEGCLDQIATQLLKDNAKKSVAVTAVTVAGQKLMLSSWEAAAFVEGGDDVSDALQRAVAARALLSRVAEEHKQGNDANVPAALIAAHEEAAALQAQVAQAKEKKNIDGAVNLAATARRLIALMEELEPGSKPPQRSAQ